MTDLRAQYTMLNAEYTTLINDILAAPETAPQKLPRVTALASQIALVLDEAAKEIAMIPVQTDELESERTELIQRLQRIQTDYSGLLQNTDKVETLRRIRSYQDTSWRPMFFVHLIAFFVLAFVVFLVVVFLRQRDSTPASPTSATTKPPLI